MANAVKVWRESEIRKVAHVICVLATSGDCVMDGESKRAICTFGNCRMMNIAKEAVEKAVLLK